MSGFFQLCNRSNNKCAEKISDWVTDEVLPALVKYSSYSIQPKNLRIKFFYDSAMISSFDKKAVIYIVYVGMYNGEHIFKYGFSRDIFRREHREHQKNFDEFRIVLICECDNCEEIENLFKMDLMNNYVQRKLTINNKVQTELFTVTANLSYEYFLDLVKKLIGEHKLPAIKEADNKIVNFQSLVSSYKDSDENKKLKLQFKLSENFKLELQTNVKLKKLEIHNSVEIKKYESRIKKYEIKLQREKNKQIAIEKGYNLTHFMDKINKSEEYDKPLILNRVSSPDETEFVDDELNDVSVDSSLDELLSEEKQSDEWNESSFEENQNDTTIKSLSEDDQVSEDGQVSEKRTLNKSKSSNKDITKSSNKDITKFSNKAKTKFSNKAKTKFSNKAKTKSSNKAKIKSSNKAKTKSSKNLSSSKKNNTIVL